MKHIPHKLLPHKLILHKLILHFADGARLRRNLLPHPGRHQPRER